MTEQEIEEYFKEGAVASPIASAPSAENLQWIPQVSPEARLERLALVHGLDNRPPKAVAVAGREPAATPVTYEQTPQEYADQSRMQQLQMGIPAMAQPAVDYPMGPTIELNRDINVPQIPQNGGPDIGGYTNQVRLPQQPVNVLRDTSGAPVLSGNGQPVGLPTQNPNYKAPAGGGKGADANTEAAIKQIGGK